MQPAPLFTLAILFGLLLDCNGDGEPSARVQTSRITGGMPSLSAASPVVYLGVGGGCTGTVVAQNLILTAKHCVTDVIGASYNCTETGDRFIDWEAGVVETTPDAGAFGATRSPDRFRVGKAGSAAGAPRVARVLVAPGTTLCTSDIAMLLLDRPLDDPSIAPLRLDRGPSLGEPITATGWGLTSGKIQPAVLQRRATTVLEIGPWAKETRGAGPTAGPVPPHFFTIGEGLCHGDSGSPALAWSGAVIGVASGLDNPALVLPSGTATDCVGRGLRGLYEATAAERDFILGAFAEAGATPWLEGQPDPRAQVKEFEASCAHDDECKSNVCVAADRAPGRCSHGCLETVCPAGYQCAPLDGRPRCLPAVEAGTELSPPPSPGGCVVANTRTSNFGAVLVLLAVICLGRGLFQRIA